MCACAVLSSFTWLACTVHKMAGRKGGSKIQAVTDKISLAIRESVVDILNQTFGQPSPLTGDAGGSSSGGTSRSASVDLSEGKKIHDRLRFEATTSV